MLGDQKDYFEKMASEHKASAILVPGASQFRNLVIDKAMRKTLTKIISDLKDNFVLEVGCGIGRWTQIVGVSNSVVAVDISRAMIKLAIQRCAGLECAFVVASASALPFKPSVFDLSFTITVLQHILSAEGFAKAISDISYCTKESVLIVDQMSGKNETLLSDVYCPIRILPADSYIEYLEREGLHVFYLAGLTYTPVLVLFTEFLAMRKKMTNGVFARKAKASSVMSKALHFGMGVCTLSALLMPRGKYNPQLSLHTILIARKKQKSGDAKKLSALYSLG